MDRLLTIEVFVAVVEAGSMAGAARRLDMTAQMVGRYIQALESRLGATVLVRTTRQHKLTEAGQDYYRRCRSILCELETADRAVVDARSEPRGRLRVTAPVTLGTACIAPVLADFMARHPRLTAELLLDDHVVDLVGGGFDVAVRVGALPDSAFVARPLADYRFALCASPGYLARHGRPRSVADLAGHQTLGYAHWPRHGRWHLDIPSTAEVQIEESRFTSNVGAALRAAALRGFGLIMQPVVLLQDDLDAGRLVPVLQEEVSCAMPVHLVFPRDRLQLPKMRAFVDFVVSRLSNSLNT